ncbi:phytoene/squalene synthase family protein [Gordonia sp. CPCC 206044]|uniref:phytoene/squalene synthase family protein n=1 Tax=Gordonia sp. CPCC 206044 TaxID=3140793 RepID=UPI003AF345C0
MAEDRVARGYRVARDLTATHGRTYFAATCLLPRPRRRAVFALYGFARLVDDLVDLPDDDDAGGAARQIDRIEAALWQELDDDVVPRLPRPDTGDDLTAVLAALHDTVDRFDIPTETFGAFLRSMRMDVPGGPLFRNRYRNWAELSEYTHGSAAVIGVQLLPLLGVPDGRDDLAAGAQLLGEAFQLTNFLRDVAEDLDRDRIYLPTDELAAFGVDEDHLVRCRRDRRASDRLRRALAHMIAVNRDQYRRAWPSIMMLPNRSRPAILSAAAMYAGILTEIEDDGYQVMDHRAVVGPRRRVVLAAQAVCVRRPGPALDG